MLLTTRRRKPMNGSPAIDVMWRCSNYPPIGQNSTQRNEFGTTRASTPPITDSFKSQGNSAVLYFAHSSACGGTRRKSRASSAHLLEHNVDLLMRVYIVMMQT